MNNLKIGLFTSSKKLRIIYKLVHAQVRKTENNLKLVLLTS